MTTRQKGINRRLLLLIVGFLICGAIGYIFYYISRPNITPKIPHYVTEGALVDLRCTVEMYAAKNGCLPQDEQQVIIYYGREPYVDGWGNLVRYKYLGKDKEGKESFMVYSRGPNGIDEDGKGDDILYYIGPAGKW